MKKTLLLIFFMAIWGCTKAENSYIGYFSYEHTLTRTERVIHIKEEHGKFYLSEDILKNSKYDELPIIDGQPQMSGAPLRISDDNNSLFISHAFGSLKADKVSSEYVEKKLLEIEKQKSQCEAIQERFKSKSSGIQPQDWNSFVDKFKSGVPKGCLVKGLNKRW